MSRYYREVYEAKMDSLCKPTGSLGILEGIYVKMATAWGSDYPEDIKARHVVFASNNGITLDNKVAAYPREITAIQYANMKANGAVINQFCMANNVDLQVLDVGIEPGTKDFVQDEAMSHDEYADAWDAGWSAVHSAMQQGYNLLSFGELGIGNTTTSAAVLFALCQLTRSSSGELGFHFASSITGHGANATEDQRMDKVDCVLKGYQAHKSHMKGVMGILRCVGGFDMVAMTAAMLKCTEARVPFVLDGFISNVCYACAYHLDPNVLQYAIPSHLSEEQGAIQALRLGGISPRHVPIHAGLCLGEGTGAILMVGILKTIKATADGCKTLQELTES